MMNHCLADLYQLFWFLYDRVAQATITILILPYPEFPSLAILSATYDFKLVNAVNGLVSEAKG